MPETRLGFHVQHLTKKPRMVWGYRHRRPFPSAELLVTDTCSVDECVSAFKRKGYAGCVVT